MPRWVLFQRPSSERLVSLSISSRSPVTTSKPRLDEHQVGCGFCAACAPHRGWSSGHLFSFPCSPTYWVTLSVVNEPTAHIPVRLCQAITAIPLGTARTPSPWASRPVGDPMVRSGGTCSRDVGAPLMPFNALAAHRPSAKAWHGRNSIPYLPMASGIQTCYRRVCGSTTGHWGLGNPALTLSRRRCRTMPYTSSDISRFPTMLLFPRPFGSR